MDRVVGVRFKELGKMYYFSAGDLDIKKHDSVIVETGKGIQYGKIVKPVFEKDPKDLKFELKNVLRVATEEDELIHLENLRQAEEAFHICEEEIIKHDLEMTLLSAENTHDRTKLLFQFCADGRVDFRDLVKSLAAIFKTRIELRQVGVRDEAKFIGALGSCGRETCCSSFLCEFSPVTINMAKDQSFSLNPSKISGMCGRLMCCLAYEHESYKEVLKTMPDIGTRVTTPEGEGVIVQISPLQELIRVRLRTEDGYSEENFYLDDIQ